LLFKKILFNFKGRVWVGYKVNLKKFLFLLICISSLCSVRGEVNFQKIISGLVSVCGLAFIFLG
ncbi:hypothetical protein SZ46_06870, partial [Brachyspira hyodysenteriae]